MFKDFIDIEFNSKTLDVYLIRKSIFNSLKSVLPDLKGNLIDIGCGKMPYKKYILENSDVVNYSGLDIENAIEYDLNVKPDFWWNGISMPFKDESFDCAFGTEVLEHCPEPNIVLKEVHRILKPNGVLFLTVPFLWNLHETPNDEYRYTPFSLERHLKESGFNDINIKATGGWHAALGQMLGLWVKRSTMKPYKRKVLKVILKPIIKYLIRMDNPEKVRFKEGQMITGLYATAKK